MFPIILSSKSQTISRSTLLSMPCCLHTCQCLSGNSEFTHTISINIGNNLKAISTFFIPQNFPSRERVGRLKHWYCLRSQRDTATQKLPLSGALVGNICLGLCLVTLTQLMTPSGHFLGLLTGYWENSFSILLQL